MNQPQFSASWPDVIAGRCVASGKIAYPNKGEAKGAARRCIAKGHVKEFGVYRCRECRAWHLTHKTWSKSGSQIVAPRGRP